MRKLLLLICLFAFSAPALAQQSTSLYQPNPCPFTIPGGVAIDCGILTVPEDHADPKGKQIQLAVARIYSSSNTPQTDPVVYLSGGPGASALAELDLWIDSSIRQKRDIILLDQRGTGNSKPALNCPPMNNFDDVESCRAHLVGAGINLSAYNSAQSAADVADLRVAMGYSQWNLLGISYGTRLALTVMRDHPEGLRSVILDSVYPPQVNDWQEYSSDQAASFHTLFQGCAADAACNSAYPKLEDAFYQTVARLNHKPILYNPTPDGDAIPLNGNTLTNIFFRALYVTDNLPYLPQVIYGVSQGDYSLLDQLRSSDIFYRSRPDWKQTNDQQDAEGDYNSVSCSEEIPFESFDLATADAQAARPEMRDFLLGAVKSAFDTCSVWSVTPASPIEALPVTSALPALVLSGEYDPATPVAWGQMAAKTLSHSFFFEFPGVAHGTIDGGACPQRIILAFLDNPTLKPDSGCISTMSEPHFVTN